MRAIQRKTPHWPGRCARADDSKPEDRPEPFLALQGRAALPLFTLRGLPWIPARRRKPRPAFTPVHHRPATPTPHLSSAPSFHTLFLRRDGRGHFRPTPVPAEVSRRALAAARFPAGL